MVKSLEIILGAATAQEPRAEFFSTLKKRASAPVTTSPAPPSHYPTAIGVLLCIGGGRLFLCGIRGNFPPGGPDGKRTE